MQFIIGIYDIVLLTIQKWIVTNVEKRLGLKETCIYKLPWCYFVFYHLLRSQLTNTISNVPTMKSVNKDIIRKKIIYRLIKKGKMQRIRDTDDDYFINKDWCIINFVYHLIKSEIDVLANNLRVLLVSSNCV